MFTKNYSFFDYSILFSHKTDFHCFKDVFSGVRINKISYILGVDNEENV